MKFKFDIDNRVTAFDNLEGVVEAQCIDRKGIFYSLKKRYHETPGLRIRYREQELTAGWNATQRDKK